MQFYLTDNCGFVESIQHSPQAGAFLGGLCMFSLWVFSRCSSLFPESKNRQVWLTHNYIAPMCVKLSITGCPSLCVSHVIDWLTCPGCTPPPAQCQLSAETKSFFFPIHVHLSCAYCTSIAQ